MMNDPDDEMAETANMGNRGEGPSSFASQFRGRSTAMSTEDLRKARESRAADALKMKDEQLKILSEQNGNLLKSLDKVRAGSRHPQSSTFDLNDGNNDIVLVY